MGSSSFLEIELALGIMLHGMIGIIPPPGGEKLIIRPQHVKGRMR